MIGAPIEGTGSGLIRDQGMLSDGEEEAAAETFTDQTSDQTCSVLADAVSAADTSRGHDNTDTLPFDCAGNEVCRSNNGEQPPRTPEIATWSALPPKGQVTAGLCCFCFEVLDTHLRQLPSPIFPAFADPSFQAPMFVTWMKSRPNLPNLELRGCVGCLEPIALRPGLSDYAIRSSTQDRRFPPVAPDELPLLTCKLSILHKFEKCTHVYDWKIGVHGLVINFSDVRGWNYTATYLPEVAQEHNMSHETAIRELVNKSGYKNAVDQTLLDGIQVTRYQSVVDSVSHMEYARRSALAPMVEA